MFEHDDSEGPESIVLPVIVLGASAGLLAIGLLAGVAWIGGLFGSMVGTAADLLFVAFVFFGVFAIRYKYWVPVVAVSLANSSLIWVGNLDIEHRISGDFPRFFDPLLLSAWAAAIIIGSSRILTRIFWLVVKERSE